MTSEKENDDVIPHSVDEDEAVKIANIAVHIEHIYGHNCVPKAYEILNAARKFAAVKRQERFAQQQKLNEVKA